MPVGLPDYDKQPCVYMLASKRDGILYIGVTSDLNGRMWEPVSGAYPVFTRRYGVTRLVCYEVHESMDAAILREKRMKEWKRDWKIRLISGFNPEWLDPYDRSSGAVAEGPADIDRQRQP